MTIKVFFSESGAERRHRVRATGAPTWSVRAVITVLDQAIPRRGASSIPRLSKLHHRQSVVQGQCPQYTRARKLERPDQLGHLRGLSGVRGNRGHRHTGRVTGRPHRHRQRPVMGVV
jgi:hypothetical protein